MLGCDNTLALSMVGEMAQMRWRTRHSSIRLHLFYHDEVTIVYVGPPSAR